MLNIELNKFKINHKNKKNQVLYICSSSTGEKEIENLLNNFLEEKNSFVFESVEKGKIKGRYTIFGKGLTKYGNLIIIKVIYLKKIRNIF